MQSPPAACIGLVKNISKMRNEAITPLKEDRREVIDKVMVLPEKEGKTQL